MLRFLCAFLYLVVVQAFYTQTAEHRWPCLCNLTKSQYQTLRANIKQSEKTTAVLFYVNRRPIPLNARITPANEHFMWGWIGLSCNWSPRRCQEGRFENIELMYRDQYRKHRGSFYLHNLKANLELNTYFICNVITHTSLKFNGS